METIRNLLEKEFRISQQAMQMVAEAKNWSKADMIEFTKLSKEVSNIRKKLSTNPNFHREGNGLMH